MDIAIFKGVECPDLVEKIESLRSDVWGELVPEDVPLQRFLLDCFDEFTWHFAVQNEGQVVASARLSIHSDPRAMPESNSFRKVHSIMKPPFGLMTRLVVSKQYRRMGLANKIDLARIAHAKSNGCKEVWSEARARRCIGLQQLGFTDVDESSDLTIPGEWKLMRKVLGERNI